MCKNVVLLLYTKVVDCVGRGNPPEMKYTYMCIKLYVCMYMQLVYVLAGLNVLGITMIKISLLS